MNIPERIWLQWHGDEEPPYLDDNEPDLSDVSWCWEPIFDPDIEYIRIDKYTELQAEVERLKETIDILKLALEHAKKDKAVF